MSDRLREALAAALGGRVRVMRTVAGGDINQGFLAETDDGRSAFVKTRSGAEADEYEAEADGLRWLSEGEVRVPEVLATGSEPAFLALEWVEPGQLDEAGAEHLGRGLARLHRLGAPEHGWLPGGRNSQRIGSLALPTAPGAAWAEFYAGQRLLPLARMAVDGGALEIGGLRAIEAVATKIEELAGPPEPPTRLHGDLWSGNVRADRRGRAWLIDPSAQGGHREMDLAMLRLFGSPHADAVFAAYEEDAPLAGGHGERVALWQLQPLLVHSVLFGGSYGASAERAARSYL